MNGSVFKNALIVLGILVLGVGAFLVAGAIRGENDGNVSLPPGDRRELTRSELAGVPVGIPIGDPPERWIEVRVPRVFAGEPDWGLLVWSEGAGRCWRAGQVPDLEESSLEDGGVCDPEPADAVSFNNVRVTDELSEAIQDAIEASGASPPGITVIAGVAGPEVRRVIVTVPGEPPRELTLSARSNAFLTIYERVYESGQLRLEARLADGSTELDSQEFDQLPG